MQNPTTETRATGLEFVIYVDGKKYMGRHITFPPNFPATVEELDKQIALLLLKMSGISSSQTF